MLQSLNYFKIIKCPLNGTCNRPYCVFKHRQEVTATNEPSQTISTELLENDEDKSPSKQIYHYY